VQALLLSLVASPRVGVVVDARMTSEFVGAGEFLGAARELASMRLLASVCANVPGLVLKAVEGLLTEWTLVWSRKLIRVLRRVP
jgi:hypothetical protein